MQKHNKKLYIGIFIAIIFTIIVLFSIHLKDKKTEALLPFDGSKASVFDETIITTPFKPKAENLPLLSQGGGSLPVQARGGNSLEPKNIQENTHSVTVLAGEVTVNLSVAPNTVFYDALVKAKNEDKLAFAGKNYPGLGFFMTDIGTLHAGNGKHLLYYINGKEATVGVSAYTLISGDIIEWKLE